MFELPLSHEFPRQRIPNNEKDTAWAAQCCDWIIAQGQAMRQDDIELRYSILHGDIPESFYRKILNPYNATQEKYKRFPATMRNYDLIKGIIRRYVGEYIVGNHDFIVSANNPDVVLAKNNRLHEEVTLLVEQKIAAEIQKNYQEFVNGGGEPEQFNPQEGIDIEAFVEKFNEEYIDNISAQGQAILGVIKEVTEDALLYARCYFDYVSFGECYTYSDIIGKKLIKRVISPRDAFPINTDNIFREDDDMFACRRKMSKQQIMDEFGDYLDNKQREFLETYYGRNIGNGVGTDLSFYTYEKYFPDVCGKYNKEDRELFRRNPNMQRDVNATLYDVWHVVWRGEVRRAIVHYVNEAGMIAQRIETDDYVLNSEMGDMNIEYIYEPQVYESVRIGTRNDGIYPYGARAVAYNRGGKLPYNGMNELLPGFDKFSIIDIITPYQIFYNIVAYHREMTLVKNKLNVLMIAKSLLGKNSEETIYKMIADGTFIFDDTNDNGMLRSQQVRFLQSDIRQYLSELSALLKEIQDTANNQVDMTAQRYGEIGQHAGKGTTQEAIVRGSMGSVILEYMMDTMRERDYARDMDYSKFAWVDGLDTSYRDDNRNIQYISLDINAHMYADYVIKAKNSVKEHEKLQRLKEFAFSAAQNGDMDMAIAAINGDNSAEIAKLIKKFSEQKQAHESQMQQMEEEARQADREFELQKIAAKGEEDRKTVELEGLIKKEIEVIRSDSNMISYNADVDDQYKKEAIDRREEMAQRVNREKLALERQKSILDTFNKEQDRQVKREDMANKLAIAKENKNRYDRKK